ncbi:MAG: T9SS type A sorting domain-containing protein [Chitinophagaceae bacterium]
MRKNIYIAIGLIAILSGAYFHMNTANDNSWPQKRMVILNNEDEEMEAENSFLRARQEWLISRDLKTGKIPEGIHAKELEWLKSQPVNSSGAFQSVVANSYEAVGPTQNGGRTRTIVHDKRYNGSSNKVILAGGISGGIFRSEDGGSTWKFVHPVNEVRSVSTLAQDPSKPDTWYAGTGEAIGVSAAYPNAFVYGNGILKSTDNGKTWTTLTITADNVIQNFGFFDIIHKIIVHPKNSDVYAAIHRKIMRSKDGGSTWETVLSCDVNQLSTGTACASTSSAGIGDLAVKSDGSKIFAAITGRNNVRHLVGIWESSTGDSSSFIRIAGGEKDAADSVAGWRGYDNATNSSGDYSAGWGRIVIALSPSNQNILYTMVENSESASSSKSEADLFKVDMTTKPYKWTGNLGTNLVAKRSNNNSASDKYMELQGGYNMMLAVHPTNPNLVLAGGVNLFRSTDGFQTKENVTFVGGISSDDTYTDDDGVSHADNHSFSFDPTNANRVLIGSDGGIGLVDDITLTKPVWSLSASQYQTIQYYHVGIDPTNGSKTFYGGAQDNSTTLRDRTSILGGNLPDSNDHYILLGGDGCQVGMTKKNSAGQQYLFCAAQLGQFYRMKLFDFNNSASIYTKIKPDNTGEGSFITYFHLDPDNTDYLYYATDDTLFRTNNAATVTSSTWTMMSGVAPAVSGDIYALETTKGPYTTNSHLFIGTSAGKIYRLKDPQGTESAAPVDISPSSMSACVNNVCPLVRDIAVNPRNQDTAIAVVSNYGANSIFWTGNATAASPTWVMIEGNVDIPSVRACEIIVKTTGVEYYIGTSVGLFSTNKINGSSTVWSREVGTSGKPSEMLNTSVVNSIASRWSDNTMVVGTHGNGMFTANLGSPISASSIVNNPTTAVFNPIRNNVTFINNIYPTVTDNTINYKVGNLMGVKKIALQVTNISGGVVLRKETGYENGLLNLGNLPAGTYVLTITSSDRKYQSVRKIIKR